MYDTYAFGIDDVLPGMKHQRSFLCSSRRMRWRAQEALILDNGPTKPALCTGFSRKPTEGRTGPPECLALDRSPQRKVMTRFG